MAPNVPIPARIPKDDRPRHAGRDLFEQLQPFPAHPVFEHRKPGRVAARPRQARDKAGADWVGDIHEHHGHGMSRLLQRHHARSGIGQDNVGRERNQFRRISAKAAGIVRGPAVVDPHVTAVGPAQLLQCVLECRAAGLCFRMVRGQVHEHADAAHALGLRPRSKRPSGRHAAEQRDEVAPSHVEHGLPLARWHPQPVALRVPRRDFRPERTRTVA